MLLVQWIDLTARRRAERARADLLLEQQARAQAEQRAERLRTLQTLSDALESLALDELLEELVLEVAMLFGVDVAGVQIVGERDEPIIVRAVNGQIVRPESSAPPPGITWTEAPLLIERASFGTLRLGLAENRSLSPIQRSLLSEGAEGAALAVRRAQLHEEEHRISVELQRGLLPKRLPDVPGIELAAHYQAAGLTAEAGGDWYDAFGLPGGRVGIVVGDVTGRGIPAATTMGQLRSVTRAFALADEGTHTPGEVLTRLNGYQMALAEEQLFTVIYGIIDPQLQVVRWANAGHPPPVLRSATRQTRLLEGGQELMGIGSVVYVDHEQTLRPGDTLILYSDGLVERRGESLDTGLQRLAVAAAEGPEELDALRGHLLVRMLAQVHELHDDVTAMLARMT
jgi:serine phosphatase RsbU (regulator of sigma subunit)